MFIRIVIGMVIGVILIGLATWRAYRYYNEKIEEDIDDIFNGDING